MEEEEPTGEFRGESQPEQRKSGTPRLYIKELVMRNFKSYAGEQRVGPFHKVSVYSFFSKLSEKLGFRVSIRSNWNLIRLGFLEFESSLLVNYIIAFWVLLIAIAKYLNFN